MIFSGQKRSNAIRLPVNLQGTAAVPTRRSAQSSPRYRDHRQTNKLLDSTVILSRSQCPAGSVFERLANSDDPQTTTLLIVNWQLFRLRRTALGVSLLFINHSGPTDCESSKRLLTESSDRKLRPKSCAKCFPTRKRLEKPLLIL